MHCGFSTKLPRLRGPARSEAARNQITWPECHRSNRHDQGQGLRGAVREHSDGAVHHRAPRPGPDDVQIEILYCGVCHSDLHTVRNEWKNTFYPCVPGHEIVGRVVGGRRRRKRFKAGDLAAVGCMVDSLPQLPVLPRGLEQYCENGFDGHLQRPGHASAATITYGGYSQTIVVNGTSCCAMPARR